MQINNDAYAAIWQSKIDPGAGRIEAQIPLILVLLGLLVRSTQKESRSNVLRRSPLFQLLLLSTREKTHKSPHGWFVQGLPVIYPVGIIKQKYRHFDTRWNWVNWAIYPDIYIPYSVHMGVYPARLPLLPSTDYGPEYSVPNVDPFCILIARRECGCAVVHPEKIIE